mgnify:CR=1 FL=1
MSENVRTCFFGTPCTLSECCVALYGESVPPDQSGRVWLPATTLTRPQLWQLICKAACRQPETEGEGGRVGQNLPAGKACKIFPPSACLDSPATACECDALVQNLLVDQYKCVFPVQERNAYLAMLASISLLAIMFVCIVLKISRSKSADRAMIGVYESSVMRANERRESD